MKTLLESGAQAASALGIGRKGSPSKVFAPGETVELANIQGSGTIRHIWMTMQQNLKLLKGFVIRGYWDSQENPSIEAPVGDFLVLPMVPHLLINQLSTLSVRSWA